MITFKALPRRSATMCGFYTVNSDHLRIEGFNITTDESLTGWTEKYGVFIRSNHVEVVDNYFYDLEATAIQGYWHEPYPEAAYVAGNTVYRSQKGIGVTGFDWVVEENEVERLFDHLPHHFQEQCLCPWRGLGSLCPGHFLPDCDQQHLCGHPAPRRGA
jgi:hypothetical protein